MYNFMNDEHSIFVEICVVSAINLIAGCSSRRARVWRIAAACWCPSQGLRKPDSGTNLSTRTVEVRPWARPPSGLSDSNYLRSKTSRPAGGGRVCERGISGPRSPAAATSCPGRPGPVRPGSWQWAISAGPMVPSILKAIVWRRAGPGMTGSCWARSLAQPAPVPLTDSSCFVLLSLFLC